MQHRIAIKVVNYFVHRQLITKGNEDWCIYFVETQIIPYFVLLLIVFLLLPLARLVEILILLLLVLLIRRRSGGYHCKTERGCFFLSLVVVGLGLLLAKSIEEKYNIQLLLIFLSMCGIFTGPVNQPELHLSYDEYQENARRLYMMTMLIVCVSVIMILMQVNISSYCVMGLFIAAISVAAGKFIQRGRY